MYKHIFFGVISVRRQKVHRWKALGMGKNFKEKTVYEFRFQDPKKATDVFV